MNRLTTPLIVSSLIVLGAAASPLAAQAKRESHSYKRELPAALVKRATVSESDAAKTAEARLPKGHIESVELENEKGNLIYSYDIKVPGKSGVEEVNVDAMTGKVVNTEHETATAEKKEAAQEKKEAVHEKKGSAHESKASTKPAKPSR